MQLRQDPLHAGLQLLRRLEACRDDDPVLPVRLTASVDGAIAVRCVSDISDIHIAQRLADLRHGRSARQDLARLRIDATVAVQDEQFGAAEVFVRAFRSDQVTAADVVAAVLAALLR